MTQALPSKAVAPPFEPPLLPPCPKVAHRIRRAAAAAAAVLLLASCSGGERPTLDAAPAPSGSSTTTASTNGPASTTSTVSLTDRAPGPDNLLGYIATPTGTPEVHQGPKPDSPKIDIPATTSVGAPTTFAVIGDPSVSSASTGGWVKVLLPTRPNEGTGWVRSSSVQLTQTPLRIFIDIAGRALRIENNGASVFIAKVAVGTTKNPTPVGASYITELIQNTNPKGSYGPYAYGLALHSETLTEFAGGPGQVGVHGTNEPQLIGQPVSHGCIRLSNDDIRKIVDLKLPLGVPVFIS